MLLVDDSIVRGTTSKEIIQMAREAGAKAVYMASAAPPVRYPNVYGIDMPTKDELVASKTPSVLGADDDGIPTGLEEQVARTIGADKVVYQGLRDLQKSITDEAEACGARLRDLDCSCFDGRYVTSAAVGDEYFNKLATKRSSDRGGDGDGPSPMHLLDRLEIPKKARAS